VLQLLVTANIVRSSLILFTLIIEAIHSSAPSVFTRAIQRLIPGDGILQGRRRENLKSYSTEDLCSKEKGAQKLKSQI
jgi:hypothetical protein